MAPEGSVKYNDGPLESIPATRKETPKGRTPALCPLLEKFQV